MLLGKYLYSIQLLSLAGADIQSQLIDLLWQVGYKNVESVSEENWAEITDDGIVLVQVVSHPRKKHLLQRLHTLNPSRVLGLLDEGSNGYDKELFSCCGELLWWPCHKHELAYRLAKLEQSYRQSKRTNRQVLPQLQLIGYSASFTKVLSQISKIADCNAPILIEGETGTGKEMLARAIHYSGDRNQQPFFPVNCGAFPDGLIESELFGYKSGAFTDAKKPQEGIITQAGQGTLFLDEVEALTPKAQVALLRFLQDKQYRPLGSSVLLTSQARIIAASNQDLRTLSDQGLFRKDLYYRLNIVNLMLPPLRQRKADIPILAEYFLDKYRKEYGNPEIYLHDETYEYLQQYQWPGNVRELENFIHREFLLRNGKYIRANPNNSISIERRKNSTDRHHQTLFKQPFTQAKSQLIAQFEQSYLIHLMTIANGNVSKAAIMAGKERRAFDKLLKKHNIDKSLFRCSG